MVLFPGIWTCTHSGLVWQVLGTDLLPFFVFPELLRALCGNWVLDTRRWRVDSEPKLPKWQNVCGGFSIRELIPAQSSAGQPNTPRAGRQNIQLVFPLMTHNK